MKYLIETKNQEEEENKNILLALDMELFAKLDTNVYQLVSKRWKWFFVKTVERTLNSDIIMAK